VNGAMAAQWVDALDEFAAALATVPRPGPWARRGACRDIPTWIFFPARGDAVDAAKSVCARCVVRPQCAAFAMEAPAGLKGIWGGLTEHERRELRAGGAAEGPAPARVTRTPRAPAGTLLATLGKVALSPGQWARVARYPSAETASSMASLLRTGRHRTPPGRWAFEARADAQGGSELYAQLVADAQLVVERSACDVA
jgi:WhiB family redox-sensing transcriptional regulator